MINYSWQDAVKGFIVSAETTYQRKLLVMRAMRLAFPTVSEFNKNVMKVKDAIVTGLTDSEIADYTKSLEPKTLNEAADIKRLRKAKNKVTAKVEKYFTEIQLAVYPPDNEQDFKRVAVAMAKMEQSMLKSDDCITVDDVNSDEEKTEQSSKKAKGVTSMRAPKKEDELGINYAMSKMKEAQIKAQVSVMSKKNLRDFCREKWYDDHILRGIHKLKPGQSLSKDGCYIIIDTVLDKKKVKFPVRRLYPHLGYQIEGISDQIVIGRMDEFNLEVTSKADRDEYDVIGFKLEMERDMKERGMDDWDYYQKALANDEGYYLKESPLSAGEKKLQRMCDDNYQSSDSEDDDTLGNSIANNDDNESVLSNALEKSSADYCNHDLFIPKRKTVIMEDYFPPLLKQINNNVTQFHDPFWLSSAIPSNSVKWSKLFRAMGRDVTVTCVEVDNMVKIPTIGELNPSVFILSAIFQRQVLDNVLEQLIGKSNKFALIVPRRDVFLMHNLVLLKRMGCFVYDIIDNNNHRIAPSGVFSWVLCLRDTMNHIDFDSLMTESIEKVIEHLLKQRFDDGKEYYKVHPPAPPAANTDDSSSCGSEFSLSKALKVMAYTDGETVETNEEEDVDMTQMSADEMSLKSANSDEPLPTGVMSDDNESIKSLNDVGELPVDKPKKKKTGKKKTGKK